MAQPLRFRYSPQSWSEQRVRQDILQPLRSNIGAQAVSPRFEIGADWTTHRFEMQNGDLALFAHNESEAYWMGNTETPSSLWRTDKFGWDEVPYHVARWAQRELLATLHEEDPWLTDYPYISWFFLPVFMSKDGRESTRAFFREHAAGFPDAGRREATRFFEEFLKTGVFDEYRHVMAGKLGTSNHVDRVRMSATMGEFIAAKILTDAGYDIVPEIEVTTGHSLDFRADDAETNALVEVTRPQPPTNRSAAGPVAAVRDTAETKTNGQLAKHGGGAVLFVDCSSFRDDSWAAVRDERPDVRHRPAVVYRARPDGHVEGYRKGSVPLDLETNDAVEFVD
ncbi:hypothetical protein CHINAEXTREME_03865 [Halobiforma lacisalsi AJ5]|uniref:Uncharacterized protein n=1 Tax=Natronobacterium lacisalsi AJ5 TaxID=358396 RepID=M0LQE1_NATLA|nr:DUF5784 family protein [Halobiforma lacisalsi]APW96957.1 hypothetical protein CHINAEXTREME_03865 [Halobiforma lacisalsi AJ5]EMA34669.1 hypothetical protein C445_07105 [Halobiforma lacisalsi AJ5]